MRKNILLKRPFFVMLAVDILILKMNYLSTRRNFRNLKAQKQYLGNVKVIWTNGQNVGTADKGVQASIETQTAPAQTEPDLPF